MCNFILFMTNEDKMHIISNHAMLYHHNNANQLIDLNFYHIGKAQVERLNECLLRYN